MIKINIKAYFYWKVEVYSVILVLFDLLQLRGGVKVLYCFSLVLHVFHFALFCRVMEHRMLRTLKYFSLKASPSLRCVIYLLVHL